MKHLIRNAVHLAKRPEMARLYAKWWFAKYMMRRSVIGEFNGGIRFTGFPTFSQYWIRRHGMDHEDLRIVQRVRATTTDQPVAIDIGANLGLFSFALAKAGFHRVYACEPIPETYNCLLANMRLNPLLADRITPCETGIGANDTQMTFSYSNVSPGQSKIASAANDLEEITDVECKLMTLPSLCDQYRIQKIDFVKIDVEGFESSVIKGAMPLLEAGRVKFIYAEVIPQALSEAGSSIQEFSELMEAASFDPVVIGADEDSEFQPVAFDIALQHAGTRRNVLFRTRIFRQI